MRGVEKVHFAFVRDLPEQAFDQRRFARAVLADDCRQFSAVQMQIDVLQHGPAVMADANAFHRRAAFPAAMRRHAVMGGSMVRRELHG